MTKEETLRLEELKQLLTPFFGVIAFKGSKSQRKNAEKELQRLQKKEAIWKETQKSLRRERVEEMRQEVSSIQKELNNLPRYWWEIYGMDYVERLRLQMKLLNKDIEELEKHI